MADLPDPSAAAPSVSFTYQRLTSDNARDFCRLCGPHGGGDDLQLSRRRREKCLQRRAPTSADGIVAFDENASVAGSMLMVPIETCGLAIEGGNLNLIQCLHVREDCRGRLLAKQLLAQAIGLSRDKDGLAVVAWEHGDRFPQDFFRHFAFRTVDNCGPLRLMVRHFRNRKPPSWTVREEDPRLDGAGGEHVLDVFDNTVCGLNLLTLGRVRNLVQREYAGRLRLRVHGEHDPTLLRGPSCDLTTYLDGSLLTVGPHTSDELRGRIEERLEARRAPGAVS